MSTMWKECKAEELQKNAFEMIGKEWMLVTAAKPDGTVNTMTASWGGLGILWGKPVAFVFRRPQRYTKEFVDSSECFSLSFFGEEYRQALKYLGTVSGRTEDKIAKTGLTVAKDQENPYFEEASMVLECRKRYQQNLEEGCFLNSEYCDKWYPEKDYHTMYVAEIEKILCRED